MLSKKWSELFLSFEETRQQIRALQEQENRKTSYAVLRFLLALSVLGFLCLLIRRLF